MRKLLQFLRHLVRSLFNPVCFVFGAWAVSEGYVIAGSAMMFVGLTQEVLEGVEQLLPNEREEKRT